MREIILLLIIGIFLAGFVSASRLPTIDGDSGAWGTVLNDFLSRIAGNNGTELNLTMVNGTNIYSSSINTTHISDGTITPNDLGTDSVADDEINYTSVTLADFTNDANYLDKDDGGTINGEIYANGNLTVFGGYINLTGNQSKSYEAMTLWNVGTAGGSGTDALFIYFPRISDKSRGLLIGHQARPDSASFDLVKYQNASYMRASGSDSQNIEMQPGRQNVTSGIVYGSIQLIREDTGGMVGIYESSPQTLLHVNGNVTITSDTYLYGQLHLQNVTDAGTCSSSNPGGVFYNHSINKPCYCNSTNWVTFVNDSYC